MKEIELHFSENELSIITDALESYKERIYDQSGDSAPEVQMILLYIESACENKNFPNKRD